MIFFICVLLLVGALLRINLREGRAKVPEKVIKDFWNRKKTPILDEGFDNIYYVFDCERISLAQGKDEAI